MSSTPDNPTDEELSEIIDDSESMDQSNIDEGGLVEAGIPPSVAEETEEPVSDDESFNIDDFDDADVQEPIKENVRDDLPSNEPIVEEPEQKAASPVPRVTNGNGTVAQFRESLSDLSRQLEIDKLTFLHNKMVESGKDIASLSDIASDIQGDSPMFPHGDCDVYDSRPSSRLDGWVTGLSFGSNKRAKKFHK